MGWHDTAQICLNGHVVNDSVRSSPEFNQKYCKQCGASTIIACQKCKKDIPGYYDVPGITVIGGGIMGAPPYCQNCGAPYPWTTRQNKIAARLKRATRSAFDFHTKFWAFIETSPLAQLALTVLVAVVGTILRSRTFLMIGMPVSGILILVAGFRQGWFTTQNHRRNLLRLFGTVCALALTLTLISMVVWRLREHSSRAAETQSKVGSVADLPQKDNAASKSENVDTSKTASKSEAEKPSSTEHLKKSSPSKQKDASDRVQINNAPIGGGTVKNPTVKEAASTRPTYSVTNPTGSIINQGSRVDAPQTVNNFAPTQRRLKQDQRTTLVDCLKQGSGSDVYLLFAQHNIEAQTYSDEFAAGLKEAGWIVKPYDTPITETRQGIGVQVWVSDGNNPPYSAKVLFGCLDYLKLKPAGIPNKDLLDSHDVLLYVGAAEPTP